MIEFFPSRTIALELGPLAVHWYGVMYLLAFLFVWVTLPKLQKYRELSLSSDDIATLLIYGILGTIVGGRLGYVIFYDLNYFLQNPVDIFKVWHGGMASHGGFIGVVVASLLFCKKYKVDFWRLADIVVVPVAVGLAFGRFGNFINEELYGTLTTLPWGMQFGTAEGLRHPTQIYALVKDLLIAGICYLHLHLPPPLVPGDPCGKRGRAGVGVPGTTFALFLILYSALRFLVEFYRIQSVPKIWTGASWMTYGQLLTIPILLAGVVLYVYRRRERFNHDNI